MKYLYKREKLQDTGKSINKFWTYLNHILYQRNPIQAAQSIFTCSKLTLETLEQGVVLASLLLTLNIFHTLF